MTVSRWKSFKSRMNEAREWLVLLLPGLLVGYLTYRWLGFTFVNSFYVGLAVIPVMMWILLSRGTKVIGEVVDPDFGELTKYRDSWFSILDMEGVEDSIFLRGEGTQEPTVMQRSSLIEIVDQWPRWTKGLEAALGAMGQEIPDRPWELFILDIKLDAEDPAWEVSVLVCKGEEDYDFIASFREGKLVELKRDEI